MNYGYITTEYKDGKIYSQIVPNISKYTPEVIQAMQDRMGVKITVRGNGR